LIEDSQKELRCFDVPFAGAKEFFFVRPSRYNLNPPRAIVNTSSIGFPFRAVQLATDSVRADFDAQLKSVKEFLDWQSNDAQPFNASLDALAAQALSRRRQALEQSRAAVNSLGFPVRD
jgi:hypothetical protein